MDYPLLNVFLTMLWFFLWIMWLMLLFHVVADIFRDDALSGWGKAGWTLTVCALPFLGVLAYLVARGRGMGERELRRAQDRERAFRAYVQQAAAQEPRTQGTQPQGTQPQEPRRRETRTAGSQARGTGTQGAKADELGRLAALHDRGAITDAEYEQAKSKVLTN